MNLSKAIAVLFFLALYADYVSASEFKVGSNVYINACGGNPQEYQNTPLTIANKIIEVPNKIIEIAKSPYGRPIITEAMSHIDMHNDEAVLATLKNFRDLTITDKSGKVLYERQISGATSIYELAFRNQVYGWGVGWHKGEETCPPTYGPSGGLDFTVLRILIPIQKHTGNLVIHGSVFKGVVESGFLSSTQDALIPILVRGDDIFSIGAFSCYYCLPRFYTMVDQVGLIEISDPESLQAVGIKLHKIEPMIYVAWLSYQGKLSALKDYIKNSYDVLLPSALKYTKMFFSRLQDYDEKQISGRKEQCLKRVNDYAVASIKEIGLACFPELEKLSYFEVH